MLDPLDTLMDAAIMFASAWMPGVILEPGTPEREIMAKHCAERLHMLQMAAVGYVKARTAPRGAI